MHYRRPGPILLLGTVGFAWLHEHGDLVFDESFFMDPRCRLDREQAAARLVARRFPNDPVYCFESCLVQVEGRRRPVALVGAIQPNLILGAAVGAKFVFYGDKDADITSAPLAGITDLTPLWRIDWASAWPIDLFLRQVRQMRAELPPDYAIVPPFFWDTTGRATIHGVLTTAQKLVGERVFLDMVDKPAFVRELFDWIADAYARLIRLFADAAGMAISGHHVGECSACMLGPGEFAEFVLPPTNKLVDSLREGSAARFGLRLHSCGRSDHLLDAAAGLNSLAGLNVGSGTSISRVRERFGDIRIDLIPDTHLLTDAEPDVIDAWVRRVVEENGGGPLEFEFHLDTGQPEANGLQIARTLRGLGIACPRETLF